MRRAKISITHGTAANIICEDLRSSLHPWTSPMNMSRRVLPYEVGSKLLSSVSIWTISAKVGLMFDPKMSFLLGP